MFWKNKISKQEAEIEVSEMCKKYRKHYPNWTHGFLVGSSLCGNKNGDSERFWKLKKIIESYG